MIPVARGTTNYSIDVELFLSTGAPAENKIAADFPTVAMSDGTTTPATDLTLSDLADITSSHSPGGLICKGGNVYRLDLPDVFTVNGRAWTIFGRGGSTLLLAPKLHVFEAGSFPPSDVPTFPNEEEADQVWVYAYTRNARGETMGNQAVYWKLVTAAEPGSAFDGSVQTGVSNGDGQWSELLVRGATYRFSLDGVMWKERKIPLTAASPYAISF